VTNPKFDSFECLLNTLVLSKTTEARL